MCLPHIFPRRRKRSASAPPFAPRARRRRTMNEVDLASLERLDAVMRAVYEVACDREAVELATAAGLEHDARRHTRIRRSGHRHLGGRTHRHERE